MPGDREGMAMVLTQQEESLRLIDFHENLLDCIRQGDLLTLEQGFDQEFDQYQTEVMVDLEHARQIFIYNTCLSYYSAHLGGLSMTAGRKLCHYYHFTMLRAASVSEIQDLNKEMMREFAWNVQRLRPMAAQPPLVRQSMEYIHAHLNEKLLLKDLAASCGVSVSTIQRQFFRAVGQSIPEYIRRERIDRACFLLKNSRMTGAEISAALGFSSQSYFIQQFRQETGMTPKAYKTRQEAAEYP